MEEFDMTAVTKTFAPLVLLGAALTTLPMAAAQAADVTELVDSCADCHGPDGASTDPHVPIIGGFSAAYTNDGMIAYREKERPCPEAEYPSGSKKGQKTTMCQIADELSDKEIEQLAAYYADKPFVRAQQDFDAALAEKGKEIHDANCDKCHAEGGTLASDDSGLLAGQWMPYLEQAFDHYSSGERPMVKKMKPKFNKLEPDDIKALINYYGSFK
jgi:sulfide dehydrogenase cytochrome subunit